MEFINPASSQNLPLYPIVFQIEYCELRKVVSTGIKLTGWRRGSCVVRNRDFASLMTRRVLEPLGLRDSFYGTDTY
jgi:hypothetical protein